MFTTVTPSQNKYIISWFPVYQFAKDLRKEYKSSKVSHIFKASGISVWGYRTIQIHRFFIPELIYLLKKFNYPKDLINEILENTWMGKNSRTTRVDISQVSTNMNGVTLKDYQQDFVKNYPKMKDMFHLRGLILSFDQGLGKTMTSLATMLALKKDKVIIVAPKSILFTVWKEHINTYVKDKKVYVVGENDFTEDYDYYIFNYESMDKLDPYKKVFTKYNTGIILDESHNFLKKSQRTQNALALINDTNCKDSLLLSGTPLKSVGSEIIPMLLMLDKMFDVEAVDIFKKAFGINTTIANDIMHARLSQIMYRKVKEGTIALPKKTETTIKVKINNGKKYTISEVKKQCIDFANQRLQYHRSNMEQYVKDYNECIEWIKKNTDLPHTKEFKQYQKDVDFLKGIVFSTSERKHLEIAQRTNEYEKEVIYPLLPNELKKKFKESKSAVKYVVLKVRGEVIGNLLITLRKEMTTEMVKEVDFKGIINKAAKKTIIFSSFVDSVEVANDYVKTLGFTPLMLHGGNGDAKSAVEQFNKNRKYNPLISTTQMLVTGVTLTVANTMIFLNKPFRYTDYLQASDRIHRIGQDTDVFIHTILLDTGNEGNLSTRMEDIMEWSRNGFETIVEGAPSPKTKRLFSKVISEELSLY